MSIPRNLSKLAENVASDGSLNAVVSVNDGTLNGVTVGKGAGSVSTNTAVGASALAANTTSGASTALGYQSALRTTGDANISLGAYAMYAASGSTGRWNTSIGVESTYSLTTGSVNTAVGHQTLYSNTSGGANVAVGGGLPGSDKAALQSNTTGNYNTALGVAALYSNTTGTNNVAVGREAGYSLTTGIGNTFIGGGVAGSQPGSGYDITTGSKNSILGNFRGNQGGLDIRTASNYIVLSDGDGNPREVINNSGKISWGTSYPGAPGNSLFRAYGNVSADFNFGPQVNSGNDAFVVFNQSNTGVYLVSGNTSWTGTSDERVKDIIEPITDAANKVSTLRAVIGKFKTDAEGTRRSFLIAQDVQAVLPEAVSVGRDEDGTLGIQYTEVIPLLVAAIKELKAEFDAYKATHP